MLALMIIPHSFCDLHVCVQENGVLDEYQLASDGVDQARLAGELFLKVLHLFTLFPEESFTFLLGGGRSIFAMIFFL